MTTQFVYYTEQNNIK